MARKTKRAALVLTGEQRAMLAELAGSRTGSIREVERAKILPGYADGASITDLMRRVGVGRPMIYKCIDKALAAGVGAGLKDAYHRPHEPEITDEAKAWVVSIACTKPTDHGLAAELWSGDIGAVAKVEEIDFDSVLHDSHDEDHIHLRPLEFPVPMQGLAVETKKKGDEQRLFEGKR